MDGVRLGGVRLTGVLHWSWLLGMALIAPVALPAGGSDGRQPQVRRRSQGFGPRHMAVEADLRLTPLAIAPAVSSVAAGTPLRLLHRWSGDDGCDWLHVEELTGESRRGWLRA